MRPLRAEVWRVPFHFELSLPFGCLAQLATLNSSTYLLGFNLRQLFGLISADIYTASQNKKRCPSNDAPFRNPCNDEVD